MVHRPSSFARDAAFFVALLATARALGAPLAHALELPNKIGMSRDAYFVVQNIYRGWNRLGCLLAVELVGMLAVVFSYRRERRVMGPALVAVGCLIAAQVVFWTLTFPANAPPATGRYIRRTGKPCAGNGNIRISQEQYFKRLQWRP